MNERFEEIRKSGRLIYEYVRGSHAYGLNTPQSDIDTGGVYVAETDEVLGLRAGYKEQISDSKSDNVWYEVGRFLELCLNSNPNMLEALFIPERCVRYCAPEMKLILEHREKFLSKKAFNALCGYAIEQIKKARGLNKKIVEPILERKTPIDFCWTNWGQGSIEVTRYLEMHGLKQIYCGLVDVPNIRGGHGVYYDWGQHIHMEWKTEGEFMDYYHAYLTGTPSPFIEMLKEHCLKDYPGIKIGDIYKTITEMLHECGCKVFLDASGEALRLGMEAQPEYIKPNLNELRGLFDYHEEFESNEAMVAWTKQRAVELLSKGPRMVAVSLGANGGVFTDGIETIYAPSKKVDVLSPVGAGDAMTAAIAYCLDSNMHFHDVIRYAIAVSAGACMTVGTKPPSKEVIISLLRQ